MSGPGIRPKGDLFFPDRIAKPLLEMPLFLMACGDISGHYRGLRNVRRLIYGRLI